MHTAEIRLTLNTVNFFMGLLQQHRSEHYFLQLQKKK